MQALSRENQLLVISHLPQIAARADAHFSLEKQSAGDLATTSITHLRSEDLVLDELCRMSGHDPRDDAARSAAANLRASG